MSDTADTGRIGIDYFDKDSGCIADTHSDSNYTADIRLILRLLLLRLLINRLSIMLLIRICHILLVIIIVWIIIISHVNSPLLIVSVATSQYIYDTTVKIILSHIDILFNTYIIFKPSAIDD